MDYQLVVLKGRSASQTLRLGDGVTTIGRQDECQLRIKSSQVSRRHCQLAEKDGRLMVKDLGSSNGTFVNGVRIDGPKALEPGDTLTIGSVTFKIEGPGSASKAAVVAAAPPASSAGDTAIVEALIDDTSPEDEFELDFDVDESPKPSQAAQATPAKAPEAKPQPPAEPVASKPEALPAASENLEDDAIADFLMNIKVEDD